MYLSSIKQSSILNPGIWGVMGQLQVKNLVTCWVLPPVRDRGNYFPCQVNPSSLQKPFLTSVRDCPSHLCGPNNLCSCPSCMFNSSTHYLLPHTSFVGSFKNAVCFLLCCALHSDQLLMRCSKIFMKGLFQRVVHLYLQVSVPYISCNMAHGDKEQNNMNSAVAGWLSWLQHHPEH